MVNIKAPETYVNEPGSIKTAGSLIKVFGTKVLVIGGEHALVAAGEAFTKSLEENQITFQTEVFKGYPTIEKAKIYAELAQKKGIEVIVAVGGGKVCDVSKAAADLAGLPVITIPTVLATCAAWASVSVIYTEEGDFKTFHPNRFTPRVILADPEILVKAPERYLKAGIVDTYAKWYELAPGLKGRKDTLPMQLSSYGAKLAFDILDDHYEQAIEAVREGVVSDSFVQVLDAVIFLAGYVGTFVGARAYSGFAHPFYHSSRRIATSRKSLHGELVAYGILAQLVLEKKSEAEIALTIQKFEKFDEAFTLEELGLESSGLSDNERKKKKEEGLKIIAQRTIDEFGGFTKLGFGFTVEEIYEGLVKADELVRKYRKIK